MADPEKTANKEAAILVYDGECPFCNAYVRMLRVRENVALQLIDARAGGQCVDDIVASGFDLDDGMVLRMGGRYYHGDACIHALALLSTSSSAFNTTNAFVFGNRWLASALYPVLRFMRNLTLKIIGRKPLRLKV